LTSVTIPASVKTIGKGVFNFNFREGHSDLKSVIFEGDGVSVDREAFVGYWNMGKWDGNLRYSGAGTYIKENSGWVKQGGTEATETSGSSGEGRRSRQQ